MTCTSQISQWKVLFWSPVDDSDGAANLDLTPVLGKDLMAPSPLLASSIVLCLVPEQMKKLHQQSIKHDTNRLNCGAGQVSHRCYGPAAVRQSSQPPCRGSSREDAWLSRLLSLPLEPPQRLHLFVSLSLVSSDRMTGRGQRVLSQFQ